MSRPHPVPRRIGRANRSGLGRRSADGWSSGLLGGLFEHLAALSVRLVAQASDASVHHLRTEKGRREIDLIVESDQGNVGIEVKLAASVYDADARHLV